MNLIRVEFRKWDGSLHWHFDVVRLGEDVHGVWLGGPNDTPVKRGAKPPIIAPAFALLIPPGQWWAATFNPAGSPFGYIAYVDICTPGVWEGSTVTAVDLDLDVVMRPDGRVELLDEDEFIENGAAMAYPEHVVDQARAAAALVHLVMESGGEPFAAIGAGWLEKAIALPALDR